MSPSVAGLYFFLIVWKSREELASHWKAKKRFAPSMSRTDADNRISRRREAVARSRNWAA